MTRKSPFMPSADENFADLCVRLCNEEPAGELTIQQRIEQCVAFKDKNSRLFQLLRDITQSIDCVTMYGQFHESVWETVSKFAKNMGFQSIPIFLTQIELSVKDLPVTDETTFEGFLASIAILIQVCRAKEIALSLSVCKGKPAKMGMGLTNAATALSSVDSNLKQLQTALEGLNYKAITPDNKKAIEQIQKNLSEIKGIALDSIIRFLTRVAGKLLRDPEA